MSQPEVKAKRTVSSRQRLLAKLRKLLGIKPSGKGEEARPLQRGLFRGMKPIALAVHGRPFSRSGWNGLKYKKPSRAEKTRRKFIAASD